MRVGAQTVTPAKAGIHCVSVTAPSEPTKSWRIRKEFETDHIFSHSLRPG